MVDEKAGAAFEIVERGCDPVGEGGKSLIGRHCLVSHVAGLLRVASAMEAVGLIWSGGAVNGGA